SIRNLPKLLWVGLALIGLSALVHFWLEVDRGTRIAPQLRLGPQTVAQTFEVITTAQSIRSAAQDAERGQRGFLITGDASYLEAYREGSARIPALLEKFKQLTADNPEQQRRWPILS